MCLRWCIINSELMHLGHRHRTQPGWCFCRHLSVRTKRVSCSAAPSSTWLRSLTQMTVVRRSHCWPVATEWLLYSTVLLFLNIRSLTTSYSFCAFINQNPLLQSIILIIIGWIWCGPVLYSWMSCLTCDLTKICRILYILTESCKIGTATVISKTHPSMI